MIRRNGFRPRMDRLDDRWLPSVAAGGLTPTLIAQAYGFNTAGANGTGQTIAIVDAFHDPNLANDLATFDKANNLPGQTAAQVAGLLSQVDQSSGRTNDGWAGEEALDVEWAHAMAPGARIVVVEARSDSLADLMFAVDSARSLPGVSVVSMSWGGSEFPQETAYDSHFTTPAGHTPVTFVASSGDNSALAGPQWPASSPNVVSVGGTTLQLGSSGQIVNESGWFGSGGGISSFEPAPAYQVGVQSTGARTTPDVSIVGDPATGLSTYINSPSTGAGSWQVVGGTSASAQIWAGLLADANQARVASGQTTHSTSTALTALYQSPGAFHPVVSGFNGYFAGSGYNLVTGLGTPNAGAVISALAHSGTAISTTIVPTPFAPAPVQVITPAPTPAPPSLPVLPDPDDPVTTLPTNPVGSQPTVPVVSTPPASTSHSAPVTTGRVVFVVPAPLPAFVTFTPNAVVAPSIPSLVASLTAGSTSTAIGSLTAVPQSLSVSTSEVRRIPDDDPGVPLPFEPANDPLPAEQDPGAQVPSLEPATMDRAGQPTPTAPATGTPLAPSPGTPKPTTPADMPKRQLPPVEPMRGSVPVDPTDLSPDPVRTPKGDGGEGEQPAASPGAATDPAAECLEQSETASEATPVSCSGIVLVSAATVALRYRLRKRSDLPQGPLDLFRCQL